MDTIRRVFYYIFYSSIEDMFDTKLFVSELPRELRSKLPELHNHYFSCKFCHDVIRGPQVEIFDKERFACKSCLEKRRRCYLDEE